MTGLLHFRFSTAQRYELHLSSESKIMTSKPLSKLHEEQTRLVSEAEARFRDKMAGLVAQRAAENREIRDCAVQSLVLAQANLDGFEALHKAVNGAVDVMAHAEELFHAVARANVTFGGELTSGQVATLLTKRINDHSKSASSQRDMRLYEAKSQAMAADPGGHPVSNRAQGAAGQAASEVGHVLRAAPYGDGANAQRGLDA